MSGYEHIGASLSRPTIEQQYLALLRNVLEAGEHREGRNGGVRSLFGAQMRHDMARGFPLLTTKRVHWISVAVELFWFLRGDTNTKFLHEHGVTIWDEWADEHGDLGPVYGAQWRSWPNLKPGHSMWGVRHYNEPIDQIANVIESIKSDPFGRRHIVSAWNPAEIDDMALPPCHMMFQFHVTKTGKLNLQLYQRSADMFLGVPFNIASYALLLMIIAKECDLTPGEFVHTLGDYHLYDNHVEQAKLQLSREEMMAPMVTLPTNARWDAMGLGDVELHHYHPHPAIKAPVSA